MPRPDSPWIKVLGFAGPSEVFVPYQSGQPRFLDLSPPGQHGGAGVFSLMPATQADAGRCGVVIGRGRTVVREVTENGVQWKMQWPPPPNRYQSFVRRGHKMTLWGTLLSGNYNYIFSYSFHDDGVIEFRAGATATNFPNQEFEAHMHNVIWRVNVDLNGAANTVHVMRHLEVADPKRNPRGTWQDRFELFNNGREGALNWNQHEFTMLHVQSSNLRNRRNLPTAYMVMPFYRGTPRHKEAWMRNDFWVTRYKPEETMFQYIRNYANNEPIVNSDVVLWINSGTLHIPRSEDGQVRQVPGARVFIGAATTMWSGFDMKPYNLMEDTPFIEEVFPGIRNYPPVR
jgi:Cu2+-containing amine oxidase